LDQRGIKRVLLYGAGKHTRMLLSSGFHRQQNTVVAILDDNRLLDKHKIEGIPVMAPSEAHHLSVDAIVLSTDTYQAEMRRRCYEHFSDRWPIIDLYESINNSDSVSLRRLKDIHTGGRCFIIGNGPSLNQTNMSLLKGQSCFCVNGFIPSGIDRFGLLPEVYCVSSPHFIRKHHDTLIKRLPHESSAFFPLFMKPEISSWLDRPNVYYLNDRHESVDMGMFSVDISDKVFLSGSVVIDYCIPIAIYMGFTTVVLTGCDTSLSHGIHFDGSPFANQKGVVPKSGWQRIIKSYEVVRECAAVAGIRIINATCGGDLKVFDRSTLEAILQLGGKDA